MPTPFMHMALAERLIADPVLPAGLRDLLVSNWGAFLLGSIAPDARGELNLTDAVRALCQAGGAFWGVPLLAGEARRDIDHGVAAGFIGQGGLDAARCRVRNSHLGEGNCGALLIGNETCDGTG